MPRPSNQGVHRQGRHDENAVHAYDLWLGGMTYAEIGRETNCDRKVARDRVLRAVALLRGEVEDKRDRIGNEHLKDMTALEVIATSDEVEVKDRIAAYNARKGHAERIAKLYGLDSVVKTEVEHSGIQNIVLDPRVLGIQDTPSNDR